MLFIRYEKEMNIHLDSNVGPPEPHGTPFYWGHMGGVYR